MRKSKSYRIKSQFRFTVFVFMCIISIVALTNTVLGLNDAAGMTKDVYAQVEIRHGDTIWDIASDYQDPETDIRKVVYEICKINEIQADELQPGMILQVPISI